MKNIKLVMIICLIVIGCSLLSTAAHADKMSFPLNAIGLSLDYGQRDSADTGLYLSYKAGFLGVVGATINADAGYRFLDQKVRAKLGFELYFMFIGFQLDFACSVPVTDPRFNAGISYAIIGTMPMEYIILFLSVGAQSFFHEKTEFQLAFTALFDPNFEF